MILQKGNYRRKVRNGDCGIMTPQNNLASKVMSTKPVGRGQDASPDIVVIVVDIDAARKLELTNDRLSGRIIRLGTGCEF